MERIKLSRTEKQVLRLLQMHEGRPVYFPEHLYVAAIDSLERLGLVNAGWAEGHELVDAWLSAYGAMYMAQNPKLSNPINWQVLTFAVTAGMLLASIFMLFVACGRGR